MRCNMDTHQKDILCRKEELMEQLEALQTELESINMTFRTFNVAV